MVPEPVWLSCLEHCLLHQQVSVGFNPWLGHKQEVGGGGVAEEGATN